MKNKIIEYLIAAVVICGISYLLFSFMDWELSPGKWTHEARRACGICSLVFTGLYVAAKELPNEQ
jgi:hypothetical protein